MVMIHYFIGHCISIAGIVLRQYLNGHCNMIVSIILNKIFNWPVFCIDNGHLKASVDTALFWKVYWDYRYMVDQEF